MKALPYITLILSILLLKTAVKAQNNAQDECRIMFYNTENLFDPEDDSLKNDGEFTPDGVRRWTKRRMYEKINKISKVVLAVGEWNPPVLIGLCEVENRNVLNKLIYQTALKSFNYRIIHEESPDNRGIDVALLYRKDHFKPLHYNYHHVLFEEGSRPTRDILVAEGIVFEKDTLFYIINHWPSRYGGMLPTRPKRAAAARTVVHIIDSISEIHPNPRIIITGDFNDGPDDESIAKVLHATPIDDSTGRVINLSASWKGQKTGTLKFQNGWNIFDQFIVSQPLIQDTTGLHIKNNEAFIFNADFLSTKDEQFGDIKPYRTYVGFKFQGGFSDHYPVYLDLKASKK